MRTEPKHIVNGYAFGSVAIRNVVEIYTCFTGRREECTRGKTSINFGDWRTTQENVCCADSCMSSQLMDTEEMKRYRQIGNA